MQNTQAVSKTLKEILEHIRAPEDLDAHPWTRSLIVREVADQASGFVGFEPGTTACPDDWKALRHHAAQQAPEARFTIGYALGRVWLAGCPVFCAAHLWVTLPGHAARSWDRIDEALLRYAYDGASGELSAEQIARYKLVGDELGAASTISDWHRKGIDRLAETILAREQFLAATSSQASSIFGANGSRPASGDLRAAAGEAPKRRTTRVRWVLALSWPPCW